MPPLRVVMELKKFPTNENASIDLQYPYALSKFQRKLVMHWAKVYKIPIYL